MDWYYINDDGNYIQRCSTVDAVVAEAIDDGYTETLTYQAVKAEFEAIRQRLDAQGVQYEVAEEDCLINTGDFYLL